LAAAGVEPRRARHTYGIGRLTMANIAREGNEIVLKLSSYFFRAK
jgi:hypothetical protein